MCDLWPCVCFPHQKGAGYHLDLFWVAVLMVICSFMGLPWYVAATVISIAHIDSLKMETETSAPGEQPKFLGVRYNPCWQFSSLFSESGFCFVFTSCRWRPTELLDVSAVSWTNKLDETYTLASESSESFCHQHYLSDFSCTFWAKVQRLLMKFYQPDPHVFARVLPFLVFFQRAEGHWCVCVPADRTVCIYVSYPKGNY